MKLHFKYQALITQCENRFYYLTCYRQFCKVDANSKDIVENLKRWRDRLNEQNSILSTLIDALSPQNPNLKTILTHADRAITLAKDTNLEAEIFINNIDKEFTPLDTKDAPYPEYRKLIAPLWTMNNVMGKQTKHGPNEDSLEILCNMYDSILKLGYDSDPEFESKSEEIFFAALKDVTDTMLPKAEKTAKILCECFKEFAINVREVVIIKRAQFESADKDKDKDKEYSFDKDINLLLKSSREHLYGYLYEKKHNKGTEAPTEFNQLMHKVKPLNTNEKDARLHSAGLVWLTFVILDVFETFQLDNADACKDIYSLAKLMSECVAALNDLISRAKEVGHYSSKEEDPETTMSYSKDTAELFTTLKHIETLNTFFEIIKQSNEFLRKYEDHNDIKEMIHTILTVLWGSNAWMLTGTQRYDPSVRVLEPNQLRELWPEIKLAEFIKLIKANTIEQLNSLLKTSPPNSQHLTHFIRLLPIHKELTTNSDTPHTSLPSNDDPTQPIKLHPYVAYFPVLHRSNTAP